MAHHSGIQISTYARALAFVLLVGTAVLSLSTREAEARRYDNGVRCAIEQADGYIDFYMPGYSFTVGNIRTTCNSTGE